MRWRSPTTAWSIIVANSSCFPTRNKYLFSTLSALPWWVQLLIEWFETNQEAFSIVCFAFLTFLDFLQKFLLHKKWSWFLSHYRDYRYFIFNNLVCIVVISAMKVGARHLPFYFIVVSVVHISFYIHFYANYKGMLLYHLSIQIQSQYHAYNFDNVR